MAANFVTINSQFRPFSFQEMLQPYQLYGQAYSNVEQGLEALQDKASEMDALKNNAGDAGAYNQYKAYSDRLHEQIDALTKGGLSPSLRAGLLQSRSDYSKNIAPIARQLEKREQLIQQQNQLQAQNPALRFDNDYRTIGIDRMMQNPQMGYRSADLDKITNQVGVLAAQLAKSKLSDPKYKRIAGSMLGYTQQEYGWSPEQLASYITSGFGQGAPKELRQIYKSALGTMGSNWDHNTQNEIIDAINKGMIAGTRQVINSQPMVDPRDQAALSYYYQNKLREQQQADAMARIYAKNASKNQPGVNDYKSNSVPSDTKSEERLSEYSNLYNSLHTGRGNKYDSAYFYDNKGHAINPMRVYEEAHRTADKYKQLEMMSNPSYGSGDDTKDYIRKKYGNVKVLTTAQYNSLKKLGYTSNNSAANIMNNLYGNIQNKYIEGYDQEIKVSDDALKQFGHHIIPKMATVADRKNGKNLIEALDENGDKTGKTVDVDDLSAKGTSIYGVRYSPRYPDKLKVELVVGGKIKTYLISPDLISGELRGIINDYGARLRNAPIQPMRDGYGNVISKKTVMAEASSAILQSIFNSYNKHQSYSSSKADEGVDVPMDNDTYSSTEE